jgi:hypothetical protein
VVEGRNAEASAWLHVLVEEVLRDVEQLVGISRRNAYAKVHHQPRQLLAVDEHHLLSLNDLFSERYATIEDWHESVFEAQYAMNQHQLRIERAMRSRGFTDA